MRRSFTFIGVSADRLDEFDLVWRQFREDVVARRPCRGS